MYIMENTQNQRIEQEQKLELAYVRVFVEVNGEHHSSEYFCRKARETVRSLDDAGNFNEPHFRGQLAFAGFIDSRFFHENNLRSVGDLVEEFRLYGENNEKESLRYRVKEKMFTIGLREFLYLGKPLALSEVKRYTATKSFGDYS